MQRSTEAALQASEQRLRQAQRMEAVGRLAASGAASVTYFETTGWRGIVERDAGNPMPERFPSSPGDVFPLYHVFADLAEWRAGTLVDAASSDPLVIEALVVLGVLALDRARARRES